MDDSRQGDQVAAETLLQPTATRKHLEREWIGIGLALDWIAMRGQPMPAQDYNARHDEAASALVDLLANTPPAIAEAVVRGAADGNLDEHVSIPSGIWPQTAANASNEASRPYRLICVDDDDENEGAILRPHLSGYRKVQIQGYFIADSWPETTLAIAGAKIRPAVAKKTIRDMIDEINVAAPMELRPLSMYEIVALVRRRLPHASEKMVRECIHEREPKPKRGPKGPHKSDRQARLQELSDRLLAPQL